MKKTLIIVVALSLLVAGIAAATVVSSKHDMRNYTGVSGRTISAVGATTSQVCVFCHHPHRGTNSFGVSSVLLWNINDATKTYATYTSPSMNSTGATGDNVDTASDASQYTLLCMGCHDGGGVSNTFVRGTVDGTLGSFPNLGTGSANLGSTLADDHPVDFDYPTVAAPGLSDIRLPTGGVVDGTAGDYPLYRGTMQCATCHDVHNGGVAGLQFMRSSVSNSAICVDCHTSK